MYPYRRPRPQKLTLFTAGAHYHTVD